MLTLKAFLGLDGSGFENGLNSASRKADKFAASLNKGSIANQLKGFLGAAAIQQGAQKIMDFAGKVNDLSEQLGLSSDEFQQWTHAAEQTGSSAEKVTGFFEKIAESREKALGGDKGAMASFAKLGISEKDLGTMRPAQIALKIGDTIKSGDVEQFRAALRDIGGKGATSLISAFKSGLAELFADTPLIKTKDIVNIDDLGDKFGWLGKTIMKYMAPVLSFINTRLGQMSAFIQLLNKVPMATAGALAGGASLRDALEAGVDAGTEVIDKYIKHEKDLEAQIKAIMNRGKEPISFTTPTGAASIKPTTPGTTTPGTNGADSYGGPQINNLQQVGAAVRFNPMQNGLQQNTTTMQKLIAVNQQLIAAQNAAIKNGYNPVTRLEGMDGGMNEMGGVRY